MASLKRAELLASLSERLGSRVPSHRGASRPDSRAPRLGSGDVVGFVEGDARGPWVLARRASHLEPRRAGRNVGLVRERVDRETRIEEDRGSVERDG